MRKHAVIVGGGVVGLWVALRCLARGLEVTVVERDGPERRSCSFGNAGMIVPSHFVPLAAPGAVRQALAWMADPASPLYVRPRADPAFLAWAWRFARSATRSHVERAAPLLRDLALASRAHYVSLADSGVDIGLVRQGLVIACATTHAFHEEEATAAHARRLGLPVRVAAGPEARTIEPMLAPGVAGIVHYPLDCHLAPDRLMAYLDAEVVRQGGEIAWNAEVTQWRHDAAGARVRAIALRDGREVAGDEFVLCGGVWSAQLARMLGVRLLLEGGKGYSVTNPDLPHSPQHCAILAEARVAVTPMARGLRVGGTMELAGIDTRIDARRVRAILDALPRYYAGVEPSQFAGCTPWSGLRPCTPDGLPCIGRTRRLPNVIVAAGHAMMGVTLAPVTGDIVAGLLVGAPPAFDLPLLAPDRFAS